MLIITVLKNKESYNRIKSDFPEVDFEERIDKLEELQEKIINNYDVAILDMNVDYKDIALELFSKNKIPVIFFNGNFSVLNNELLETIEEITQNYKKEIENKEEEEKVKYIYVDNKEKEIEIKEVEKIVEKIVEVEKPVVIEKEKIIEKKVEVVNNSTIVIVSGCTTGKSFLTWNLAYAFSERKYKTSVVNLDKHYSANMYFGIEDEYAALKNINNIKDFNGILEKSYYINDELRIITDEICSEQEVDNDKFLKLLNLVQSDSDITIIDCKSNVDENMKIALSYASSVLVVCDTDKMHYKENLNMLDKIKDVLNTNKTILVINNIFNESDINFIEIGKNFKDIVTISNCGADATNMMSSNTCPYISSNDKFKSDFENLLSSLQARKSKKKKSFLKKLLFNQ